MGVIDRGGFEGVDVLQRAVLFACLHAARAAVTTAKRPPLPILNTRQRILTQRVLCLSLSLPPFQTVGYGDYSPSWWLTQAVVVLMLLVAFTALPLMTGRLVDALNTATKYQRGR